MDGKSRLNQILERFPYSGKQDQLQILANFFIANSEGNQKHVKQKTGISQPTVRKIKKIFSNLNEDEKAVLIGHISDSVYSSVLEDLEEQN